MLNINRDILAKWIYTRRTKCFFEWNNRRYYTYCCISQTGNRYFQYKENNAMTMVRVDGIGVGNYDAKQDKIKAEEEQSIKVQLLEEMKKFHAAPRVRWEDKWGAIY